MDIPCTDRQSLDSSVLRGAVLHFWMNKIDVNTEYSELGVAFESLRDTFWHLCQLEEIISTCKVYDNGLDDRKTQF